MKVLFAGLGSAGQRHVRNLRKLYGESVEILAYRVRKLQRTFDDNMHIREDVSLDKEYGIKVFDSFDSALRQKPDIVFITNRNSEHMKYAMQAARADCHLFIEKPVSDTLAGIDELEKEVKDHNKIAYVGYQNRLHPCIKKAKEILQSGVLGNIYMAYSELGEYLPKMHPWEDYRKMHEANSALGGGVVICQLHELDYLYYLFGMPEEVYSIGGHRSFLEIDVEDTATSLCRYEKGGREFAVNIHLDFLQSPPVRHCKIAGEFGRLEFDLIHNQYCLSLTDGTIEKKAFADFERNDMFLEELRIFMEAVETGNAEHTVTVHEGKKSIEFATAIKESMATGKVIKKEKM